MEDKNQILALVLMFGILMVYLTFFTTQPPTTEITEKSVQEVAELKETTASPSPTSSSPTVSNAVVEEVPQRTVLVETDLYVAKISSNGGTLTSFELKEYRKENTPDAGPVNLLANMVQGDGTLGIVGEGQFDLSTDTGYLIAVEEDSIQVGNEPFTLQMAAKTRSGLTLIKSLTFTNGSFQVDMDLKVVAGELPLQGKLGIALRQPWDDEDEGSTMTFIGPITKTTEDKEQVKIGDIQEDKPSYGASTQWTAFADKYFIRALVFGDDKPEQVLIGKEENLVENLIWTPGIGLPISGSKELKYTLYFGPRDMELLEPVGNEFEKSMDYGIFAPIAQPLMWVLKWFYGFIGNYGWAIILLTVCIKLAFWPLTHKSYTSMKAMQKLQPEMQKIREKFKNDKQRLQMEMMALYKEHRVNPMGGCLPMLIQIPVFFALYRVLLGSVEMRHAPFMGWITDLSAADTLISGFLGLPFALGPLPLIMGASMWLQQKLSPSTMDPAQARIFMMMPIVFTVMFLSFPSGLVIYWLVNNLLSIAQQLMINKKAA